MERQIYFLEKEFVTQKMELELGLILIVNAHFGNHVYAVSQKEENEKINFILFLDHIAFTIVATNIV
jgi:hypothetical protein